MDQIPTHVTPRVEPTRGFGSLTSELGLLYGCDYNPEQWSREVWVEDVALMRAAGVNLVTVGVFSWALLEPQPGEFDMDWLGDVLDLLHAGGIAVDLATPTASPPAWMVLRWPETRAVTADGVRLSHGSRNHFCPSSSVYRERALKVAGALVDRFASHPAVRMWHIGNEFGQVCHCDQCGAAFQAWLRTRYGTLDELNRAWGTTFWSQRYDDWTEIVPPRAAPYLVNPTQGLDYRRFASDALLALYTEQRDLMRALAGGAPWLVMEQAAGAVNWRGHNLPKTPGRMRLDSLRAIARGADGSCFFQWRQSAFGAERFHTALVPHAGPDTRLHRAVGAHGAELRRLDRVVGARVGARVALVFDWSSWWAAEERAVPSDRLRVMDQLLAYYRPLWRSGIAVDVVHPGGDLSGYDLVVAPQLYLVDDDDAQNLRGVVERGGVLLLGPFSGVADADAHIRLGRFPVPFADLVGGSGEEYCPLPDTGIPVSSSMLGDFTATLWGERLRVDDGEAVATFGGGDLDGLPAVLRRRAPSGGEAWYVGTIAPAAALADIVARCARSAGVVGVTGLAPGDGELPE